MRSVLCFIFGHRLYFSGSDVSAPVNYRTNIGANSIRNNADRLSA